MPTSNRGLRSLTAGIEIEPPEYIPSSDGDGGTVQAQVVLRDRVVPLRYTFRRLEPRPNADAFVTALLLTAMRDELPIRSDAPVSARLLAALPTIQDIYATWVPGLRRVPVAAPAVRQPERTDGAAMSFFTGGLDSFYTYLSHRDEIQTLVFVHGLDVGLADSHQRAAVAGKLRAAATGLGVGFAEVETNIRLLAQGPRVSQDMSNPELAHGAELASVAQLMPEEINRAFIPASSTYRELVPWGSHPLLDPLWSTDRVAVVHDGCTVGRVGKAALVGRSDVALGALRVCAQQAGPHNCGKCEKCLRTMINLRAVGALDRCTAFPEPLDLLRVSLIDGRRPLVRAFLEENLAAIEERGEDPNLARALRQALHPGGARRRALQVALAAWRVSKRWLPVDRRNGRLVWRPAGPRGSGGA